MTLPVVVGGGGGGAACIGESVMGGDPAMVESVVGVYVNDESVVGELVAVHNDIKGVRP
jgi:hypothetical protein